MSELSKETAARERLEAFVGEWTMEAGPPGGPAWPGEGRMSFRWMEGAPLLVQRWQVDMPEAPNGIAVIGCDGKNDSYFQLYTDARDVQRIYSMTFDGRVWTLAREGEPFSQRATGEFSEDGNTIAGSWEMSDDGESWRTDFAWTYRKVS